MKSRISFLQFYLIIYLDLWKVSLLVVIITERHTFATHFYVNRTIYISLYVLHLKQFTPRSIIKFSFYTLFSPFLSFPTFILSCSSECLYLSDCSIDSFIYIFFYLFHFILCFTLYLFYLFLHIYTHHLAIFLISVFSLSLSLFTLFIYFPVNEYKKQESR